MISLRTKKEVELYSYQCLLNGYLQILCLMESETLSMQLKYKYTLSGFCRAGQVAQWVKKLIFNTKSLSWILATHMAGQNQLPQVVL